jgi:hypothetical protein
MNLAKFILECRLEWKAGELLSIEKKLKALYEQMEVVEGHIEREEALLARMCSDD